MHQTNVPHSSGLSLHGGPDGFMHVGLPFLRVELGLAPARLGKRAFLMLRCVRARPVFADADPLADFRVARLDMSESSLSIFSYQPG